MSTKNKVNHKSRMQQEFAPSYKASDTEATEQCGEPESASLSLAEQVDSDGYKK